MRTYPALRRCRPPFALSLLALLLLGGCESDNSKRAKVEPPVYAPPTITSQPSGASAKPDASAKPRQEAPSDPIPGIIATAEQTYAAGQADYKAGHLDAAKQDFDRAVGMLMQAPVDVQSDDRLRAEFDKIVDGTHALEMAALQQGDGFTEQRAEPAPIDEANSITFPADPNVTAKAAEEVRETKSDLPLVINEYVAGYVNYFSTRGRSVLENAWQRGGRYHRMITQILKEEGVPQDLFYLAQAESGFHPLAVSRVGARGMWQFMHYTAPGYGLQHTWWVDDRQDPEKSTRAAARYLKDLYNQFGDWYLAMAAYNSGAGNVQRAVQRTGYVDFWELYRRNVLPAETKNYVPIILAMTIIAKNPSQYGLTEVPLDRDENWDHVTTDYAVDLRLVAESIDVPVEQIDDLNPSLIRGVTPNNETYDLKLPAGTKDKFLSAIAAIPPDKRVLWRYHRVVEGETLASIAKKYRTTSEAIAEVNNLVGDDLKLDSKLVIPVRAAGRSGSGSAIAFSRKPSHYKVRKGDTVLSVADDFGVPPERIRRWNRLKGNTLRAGRRLVIYKPLAKGAAPERAPSRRGRRTSSRIRGRRAHDRSAQKKGTSSRKHRHKGAPSIAAKKHKTRASKAD